MKFECLRHQVLAQALSSLEKISPLQIYFAKTTTAVDFVTADKADAAVYDLAGRRVIEPEKGVYIVGGKKVLVAL